MKKFRKKKAASVYEVKDGMKGRVRLEKYGRWE